MEKRNYNILIIPLIILAMFLFGCESGSEPEDSYGSISFEKQGNPPGGGFDLGDLTEEEAAGLLYMVEEEKLAHDVYVTFNEMYGEPIFENISQSEAAHMRMVSVKIAKYGLVNPIGENGIGEFVNPEIQELFNYFVEQGSSSLNDALNVGGAIEETDIIDLWEQLDMLEGNLDIQRVYSNLLNGSKNHLKAFVRVLDFYGVQYEPQYLTQEQFDSIMNETPRRKIRRGN
ncbi:MAG: DUF2202 domain-containing protein [Melioribacteraceae bacterium]|nr:DUF2202 domain-containing protein [Melioribacteraceae bacterium]